MRHFRSRRRFLLPHCLLRMCRCLPMLPPLVTDTEPPTPAVALPPATDALPPLSVLPLPLAAPPTSDTDPPDPAFELAPPATVVAPPSLEAALLLPALIVTMPPAPTSPAPTPTVMAPPAPDSDADVDNTMPPLAPSVDAPVLRRTVPLTPAVPASPLAIAPSPLDVALLAPVVSVMAPPDALADGAAGQRHTACRTIACASGCDDIACLA